MNWPDSRNPVWPTVANAVLFALACLLFNGYVFGVGDHGIHLVFLDRLTGLAPREGDLLADAASRHVSLLWPLLSLPARWMGYAPLFAGVHLATLLATGWALQRVHRSLWPGRVPPVCLLVCALALPCLGGIATLDNLVVQRSVALPIELAALAWLFESRHRRAALTLGLAATLHAPSALGLLGVTVGVATVRGGLSQGLRTALWGSLGALPLLGLAAFQGADGVLWTRVDYEWESILRIRLSHHLFPETWSAERWAAQGAVVILGLVALSSQTVRRTTSPLALVLLGCVAWALLVGVGLGQGLKLAVAFALEPWQLFRFVSLLCLLTAGHALATQPHRALRLTWALVILVSCLFARIYVDSGTVFDWLPSGPAPVSSKSSPTQLAEDGDVATWANRLLPEGSTLAVPPGSFGSARWRIKHPILVTWKDGGEALLDREFAITWRDRVEGVCGRILEQIDLPARATGFQRVQVLRRGMRLSGTEFTRRALHLACMGSTHMLAREPEELPAGARVVGAYSPGKGRDGAATNIWQIFHVTPDPVLSSSAPPTWALLDLTQLEPPSFEVIPPTPSPSPPPTIPPPPPRSTWQDFDVCGNYFMDDREPPPGHLLRRIRDDLR